MVNNDTTLPINGGPEYIFSWDSEMGRLAAIDVDASILPDALEQEISARLEAEINEAEYQ